MMSSPISEPEFKHWMEMMLKVATEQRDEQRITNALLREIVEEPTDNPIAETIETIGSFFGGPREEPRARRGKKRARS